MITAIGPNVVVVRTSSRKVRDAWQGQVVPIHKSFVDDRQAVVWPLFSVMGELRSTL